MKIPAGKSVTIAGKTYKAGDELPEWAPKEVKAALEKKPKKSEKSKPATGDRSITRP
jgi:hypothetical protein